MVRDEPKASKVGLLGELEVELMLVKQGWHPVRLDTGQMATNADLLAISREHRVCIQVKTTNADRQRSHSQWLGFGYSTRYLRDGNPIFNSKDSPLIADVIVAVSYRAKGSRFVVMPVAFAEELCRSHCDYWHSVPTRDGLERSNSFPIYLCFEAERTAHGAHHAGIRRNLEAFEGSWNVLCEPIEKLHDARAWRREEAARPPGQA